MRSLRRRHAGADVSWQPQQAHDRHRFRPDLPLVLHRQAPARDAHGTGSPRRTTESPWSRCGTRCSCCPTCRNRDCRSPSSTSGAWVRRKRCGSEGSRSRWRPGRVGLELDLTAIERMPNTARAHDLLRRVATLGEPALYEALLERLFAAYFQRGEDIGDAATLRALAWKSACPPIGSPTRPLATHRRLRPSPPSRACRTSCSTGIDRCPARRMPPPCCWPWARPCRRRSRPNRRAHKPVANARRALSARPAGQHRRRHCGTFAGQPVPRARDAVRAAARHGDELPVGGRPVQAGHRLRRARCPARGRGPARHAHYPGADRARWAGSRCSWSSFRSSSRSCCRCWSARAMGFNVLFGLLSGGATAICGASAALALAAALPAHPGKDRATLFTVIGVSALSTVAMIVYPMIVRAARAGPDRRPACFSAARSTTWPRSSARATACRTKSAIPPRW